MAMTPPPSTEGLIERLRAAMPHCNHHANAGLCHEAADALETSTPPTPEGPPDDVLVILREQTDLVERLCDAVDRAADDIGGEGALAVLGLLGPVNDRALEALARFTQPKEGE